MKGVVGVGLGLGQVEVTLRSVITQSFKVKCYFKLNCVYKSNSAVHVCRASTALHRTGALADGPSLVLGLWPPAWLRVLVGWALCYDDTVSKTPGQQ